MADLTLLGLGRNVCTCCGAALSSGAPTCGCFMGIGTPIGCLACKKCLDHCTCAEGPTQDFGTMLRRLEEMAGQ